MKTARLMNIQETKPHDENVSHQKANEAQWHKMSNETKGI